MIWNKFCRKKESDGEISEEVGVGKERVVNCGWFIKEGFEWAEGDDWVGGQIRSKKSFSLIESQQVIYDIFRVS